MAISPVLKMCPLFCLISYLENIRASKVHLSDTWQMEQLDPQHSELCHITEGHLQEKNTEDML